jgi:hypothetical protein
MTELFQTAPGVVSTGITKTGDMLKMACTRAAGSKYPQQGILLGQLVHKEEEKANPKGKGKLIGDGLSCLLFGDWFYERVVEFEAWQQREEREKEARLEAREERGEALAKWREQQEEKKVAIAARRAEWETEKQVWETEKAAAKLAKKKFDRPKPLLKKLPPAIPRPKVSLAAEGDDEEEVNS